MLNNWKAIVRITMMFSFLVLFELPVFAVGLSRLPIAKRSLCLERYGLALIVCIFS
jgi:Sec-independent protein secretion pathway component TatC